MINKLDREALREQFRTAQPFPFVSIDGFLAPEFAKELAGAYPTFEKAREQGFGFNFVNEQKKIQITDRNKFPDPVRRLNEAISSPQFLADLEYITGIPRLLVDEKLEGGGMHLTGPGGRLDVHVDFNFLKDRKLYRRLNILLYLNPVWHEEWGGHIELWDKTVKTCHYRSVPLLNRCVIFETSDISYHGVAPIVPSAEFVRQSFAAYYYTVEAPPSYTSPHSTVFRARPNERLRGLLHMPVEKTWRQLSEKVGRVKSWAKTWIRPG
jgi:Rps23 Pro-64 3,4-dihydroxylase Tpa1-like proline 4-hydroxylase